MKRTGVYPGTFDPVTFGHVDIIKRAVALVDCLIIAVAANVSKKPLFSIDLRTEMVREEIDSINNDKIIVKEFSGLLVDFASKNNATLIVRGLRAVSDFEYEFKMSWVNHKLNNEIETVFLPSSKDTQFISSNFVKEVAFLGGDISKFVPKHVITKFDNVSS
ncbi:MAG: pantetheine-phosphate adenylyltransferase [Rickettsiaceae bacterium H1]|nr:pantetheine-phosphate adenylyltransferase [Rickettsiaceae bacterium H1]